MFKKSVSTSLGRGIWVSCFIRSTWVLMLIFVFWQACSSSPHQATSVINDKLAHYLVFVVLSVWMAYGWDQQQKRSVLLLFLAVYGLAIEIVQFFVPNRFFSLLDWGMDILGLITTGLLIKLRQHNVSS